MTAVVRAPLTGEILPPGEAVAVVFAPVPLLKSSERMEAPAGSSVREIVDMAAARGPTTRGRTFTVTVGGEPVPEELWDAVRVKAGVTVVIRGLLGKDSGNFLKTLLLLGVAILGIAVPFLFPALAGTFFGALVVGAITIGGSFLINMLFPNAKPQLGSDKTSQIYSLTGAQNRADPFGIIPTVLGKHRIYPKLGSRAYTEIAGDDEYLHLLLIPGYGPLPVNLERLGDTALTSFDDYDIEIREGYATDDPLTLFPGVVNQTNLSVDLHQVDGWTSRTTDAGISVISVDIAFPAGLYEIDAKTGERKAHGVTIAAEYREVGSVGAWSALGALDVSARDGDAFRRYIRRAVTTGQYDVRLSKTSPDSTDDRVVEQAVWTALRGFERADPNTFPKPLCQIALRIKANSQLNGDVSEFSVFAQGRVAKAFNGTTWNNDRISQNPADLFRHVLQGPANARPRIDAQIDIATLEDWWGYCNAEGFACNLVVDFEASVYEIVATVAACGRAAVIFRDGLWSVVWEDPAAPIVDHYTPGNSWGFRSARAYKTAFPHAFRVQFINEDKDYARDERVVYDDGYDAGNATLFEVIEFPGVTDPDLIWRHARFHIAQARLRPEVYTLNIDAKQLVCTRGDRVRVTHDVTLWGLGWGRVKSVSVPTVVLDTAVVMEAGQSYQMRFQQADGTSILRNVTNDPGEQATIVLSGAGTAPEAGAVFMFGLVGEESVVLRVLSIKPGEDLSAQLDLVDDAPEIASADEGDIPPFDSHITPPVDPYTLAPFDLSASERLSALGDAGLSALLVAWKLVDGQAPERYQIEVRDDAHDATWRRVTVPATATKSATVDGLGRGQWSIRVRSIFRRRDASNSPGGVALGQVTFSAWSAILTVTVIGPSQVPEDVTDFRAAYVDNVFSIDWTEPADFRPLRFQIKKGDTWATALFVGDVAHPPFVTRGDGMYWIKAYAQVNGRIYSANAVAVLMTGSVLSANVVATYDEAAAGWTGNLSALVIDGGTVKTTGTGIGYYEQPDSRWVDVGMVRPTRLSATFQATGAPASQNILALTDFLGEADILGSESADLVEAWVEVAIANDVSTDVFATAGIFGPSDIFASSASFGPWQRLTPGVYVGRIFKFQLALRSTEASVIAYATAFATLVDVPDRVDHKTDVTVPSGGLTFNFRPDGAAADVPFKGGPNGATKPHFQVTIRDSVAGDRVVITDGGTPLASCTVQIMNGAGGVARQCDIYIQGW